MREWAVSICSGALVVLLCNVLRRDQPPTIPSPAPTVLVPPPTVATRDWCEGVMEGSGGPLGFRPEVFYTEVQRLMKSGEVSRISDCEWQLDLRSVPLPGVEVQITNGRLKGNTGVVWTFKDLDDPPRPSRPDQVAQVHFGSPTTLTDVAFKDLRVLNDSLSTVFPGPECPFTFSRVSGFGQEGAVEVHAAPYTLRVVERLPSGMQAEWTGARWRWCAHPGHWAEFCRVCGFSCNQFPEWSPEGVHPKHRPFPLRLPPASVRLGMAPKSKTKSAIRHDIV
eukprot:Hpha_TRINITY_DN241_c0_g2::TRINITY_DN241_c0_g2_i1::g.83651::m.83651